MKKSSRLAGPTFLEVDPRTTASAVAQSSLLDPFVAISQALRSFVTERQQSVAAFAAGSSPLIGHQSIVGYGLGRKVSGGSLADEWAIEVLVKEKLEPRFLSEESFIPATFNGFPTDVKVIGEIFSHAGFQGTFSTPVPAGCCISLAKPTGGFGTLGCLVVAASGNLCILSNDHVMGGIPGGGVGSKVVQRAFGSSDLTNIIATVEQTITPQINSPNNDVDAAIASTMKSLVSAQALGYGQIDPNDLGVQEVSQFDVLNRLTVQKSGMRTGFTQGVISGIMQFPNVNYGTATNPRIAGFNGIIRVSGVDGPFSLPGDSGSLVVESATKRPVGLLFAGNQDGSTTFVIPIQTVIDRLGLQGIVTSFN